MHITCVTKQREREGGGGGGREREGGRGRERLLGEAAHWGRRRA